MAQLNISLNQEEILELLSANQSNSFREMLQKCLNAVLQAESAEQLGAQPYERTAGRTGVRNGSRVRKLTTRVGRLELTVPRHRNVPFRTLVFENYSRSEAALVACMGEMVVNGVSTRKVSQVMETLCGASFSKSSVSEVCKDLDVAVKEFRERPLNGKYPFLLLDATYFKVREHRRVISKAFMIAYGTNEFGLREILGFGVYKNESKETWNAFLQSLKRRGLRGLMMITSDAHEGIRYAISRQYPEVPWQRCQFHFSKNISDKAPKKHQVSIRAQLQEMFACETIAEARKKKDSILRDYSDVAEAAMKCLNEGFESAMTVMLLPKGLRRFFRTSNHIERLNRELKRRSRVIGIFPNENSLLRLMGSVLCERSNALQSGRAIFTQETYAHLLGSDVPGKLIALAKEQGQQLAAA